VSGRVWRWRRRGRGCYLVSTVSVRVGPRRVLRDTAAITAAIEQATPHPQQSSQNQLVTDKNEVEEKS
jgi:hypothetical protein